ncbi:MAG: ribbon-helix-helix protein, CopG family [Candidatus Bathyarchaeia archaeon]
MPKHIVKTVLSREQHEILKRLAQRLGTSESEIMRTAFMEYAKSLSLVKEHVKQFNSRKP